MDTMSLRDVWLVAIPEIILSIIFGLLLINRNVFRQKNSAIGSLIRLILSVIIVLIINYYTRIIFQHIILISYCTVFAYTLVFKIMWRKNLRQSLLTGLLITYLIIGTEIITLPLMNTWMQRLEILSLFSIRFTVSIPSRIIDIIIILTTVIFNIKIETKLVNKEWNSLATKEKTSIVLIFSLFIAVIMIATNNIELFAKLMENGIDINFVNKNLQYGFYGIVFFMITSVLLFYTTIKCYRYKEIALKTPEQIVRGIASVSSPEKIHQYICILQQSEGGEK